MGLAASQGRLLMLTARKSDIELSVQFINQKRMHYAMQASALGAKIADCYKPVPEMDMQQMVADAKAASALYEQQMTWIQLLDKPLEMQANDLNSQHKEVETEYEAVQKVIQKNIEVSFKTLG